MAAGGRGGGGGGGGGGERGEEEKEGFFVDMPISEQLPRSPLHGCSFFARWLPAGCELEQGESPKLSILQPV